jgi:hypothetical protein
LRAAWSANHDSSSQAQVLRISIRPWSPSVSSLACQAYALKPGDLALPPDGVDADEPPLELQTVLPRRGLSCPATVMSGVPENQPPPESTILAQGENQPSP